MADKKRGFQLILGVLTDRCFFRIICRRLCRFLIGACLGTGISLGADSGVIGLPRGSNNTSGRYQRHDHAHCQNNG